MQISAVFHYQEIVFDREKKIKDSFITCFASQESLNKQSKVDVWASIIAITFCMDDHGSTTSNAYCDPLMSILAPEFPHVTLFGPFTEKKKKTVNRKKSIFGKKRKEKKRKEYFMLYIYFIDIFDNSMKI